MQKSYVCPIKDRMYLYSIPVSPDEEQPVVTKRQKSNHIIIFDRSGSMTWLLPELCEDLVSLTEIIPTGDTLTLGWFSSEGKFNWIFKGLVVSDNKNEIAAAIRKNKDSIALTCFSDILTDTADNVINDLSALGGSFSMTFLTDGYPVVSNYSSEISKIMNALSRIKSQIASVLFIGYGDYYNKELMVKMAEKIGGTLIHASHLVEFEKSTIGLVTGNIATKRVEVAIPGSENISVFSIGTDGNVTAVPYEGEIAFVPEGTSRVYVLSEFRYYGFEVREPEYAELLGAAFMQVASAKADEALSILGATGDVFLMKSIESSWTNAEFGMAQERISEAIAFDNARFKSGINKNYLPDPNAFCLVDALYMLMDDPDAYFYPRRPEFEYKLTGVKTSTRDGYPKFEADKDTACSFSKLVWNSERLNLGVLALIDGKVDLGEEASAHGLAREFDTVIWRNYVIVKDGVLNVTSIPASMSESTFDALQRNGMIASVYEWKPGQIYNVRLNSVPVVNRALAKPMTSVEYCKLVEQELNDEYRIKFLKWWLEQVDPEGIATKSIEYSPDQQEFLKTKGINDRGEYAPPVDKEEATDYYFAKRFQVKVKGFSSIPKVADTVSKGNAKAKPLTPSESMLYDYCTTYKDAAEIAGVDQNNAELAKWIKNNLDFAKRHLGYVRNQLQSARFAILLCKQWFTDQTTRDGAVVKIGDMEYTISITDVKVDY